MNDPLVKPAQDLAEIRRLAGELESAAFDHADDHDMPGGEALASLAPVANQEAWRNRVASAVRLWNAQGRPENTEPMLDDLEWEPPLQTLVFWSEQLRYDHDAVFQPAPHEPYPTIESEAKWLGNSLNWIYEHEPRWEDFASDLWNARRRLESLLREGERVTPGIPCPKCREAGRRNDNGNVPAMVRVEHERSRPRGCNGHGALGLCPVHRCDCTDRGGLIDEWRCPLCGLELRNTERHAEYDEAVFKDYVASAPYLEGKYVERRTNVGIGTVRVWVQRGYVRTQKDAREKLTYCIADIEARHAVPDDAACALG